MPRINPIDPADAPEDVRRQLDAVGQTLGRLPNLITTLAVSPPLLRGYLDLRAGLSQAALGPKITSEIGLVVAQATGSDYIQALQAFLGARLTGLTPEQIVDAEHGRSTDPRSQAALDLATRVLETYGRVTDDELATARSFLTEAEIAEVPGVVAMNVLIGSFANLAALDVDFPVVAGVR